MTPDCKDTAESARRVGMERREAESAAPWRSTHDFGVRELRTVLGNFLTGVTVITTRDADGSPWGFTANSFTSVSLAPPLVLFCIGKAAASHGLFTHCNSFAVSILRDTQRDVSRRFSTAADREASLLSADAPPGMPPDAPPVIAGALGTLVCRRGAVHDAGDHSIVLGEVMYMRSALGQPLGYLRGGYVELGVSTGEIERLHFGAVRISVLVDDAGKILLARRAPNLPWELPSIPLLAGEKHRRAIPRLLEQMGADADVSALFSVYQDEADSFSTIVYRGESRQAIGASGSKGSTELQAFGVADEPWTQVRSRSEAAVLKRYFDERASAAFSIYWDTPDDAGRIASFGEQPRKWRSLA